MSVYPPARPRALDVEIRPLTDADIPALSAELGRDHAKYFRRRLPLQKAGKALILAAFRKGWPVGAVLIVWGEPAQEAQVRLKLSNVPLLYHVRVKDSLRCRGIGTQLLAAAHDALRAQGHKEVALGVDVKNKDAIRLYERLGYDRWDQDGWGRGSSRYELMKLDLEKNDRLEYLGSATTRPDVRPQIDGERPPPLSKQELGSVIAELLGEVSATTEAECTAVKISARPKRRSVRPTTTLTESEPDTPALHAEPTRFALRTRIGLALRRRAKDTIGVGVRGTGQ